MGSTDNDDDYPRVSEWISGEYPSFTPEIPIDQYMKEIIEFTPLLVEIENDIHLSIGTRNKTSGPIEWEALTAFTDQTMYGTNSYGKYFSFQCVANAYNDYYKLSELIGQYVITGRR